jgi:hypothetical protein
LVIQAARPLQSDGLPAIYGFDPVQFYVEETEIEVAEGEELVECPALIRSVVGASPVGFGSAPFAG